MRDSLASEAQTNEYLLQAAKMADFLRSAYRHAVHALVQS